MRRHNPKANGQPTRAEKKALNRARAAAARAKAAGRGSKGGRGKGRGKAPAARGKGRRAPSQKMTRAERKALNKAGRKARREGKVSRAAYQLYGAEPIGPRNAKGYFNMKTNPGFTLQGLLDALLGAFRRDQKKVAAAAPKGVGKAVVRRMAETNTARGALWVRRPARGASGVVVAVSNPRRKADRDVWPDDGPTVSRSGYRRGQNMRSRSARGRQSYVRPPHGMTRRQVHDWWTAMPSERGAVYGDDDDLRYVAADGAVSMRTKRYPGGRERVAHLRDKRGASKWKRFKVSKRRKNPSATVHRASAKKMRLKARRAKQALNKAYYRGAAAAHAGAKKANPRRGRR